MNTKTPLLDFQIEAVGGVENPFGKTTTRGKRLEFVKIKKEKIRIERLNKHCRMRGVSAPARKWIKTEEI